MVGVWTLWFGNFCFSFWAHVIWIVIGIVIWVFFNWGFWFWP